MFDLSVARRLTFPVVLMALLSAPPAGLAAPPGLQVEDHAGAFVRFWDATTDLPMPQRVERFKREVAPLFPAFYGVERFGGRVTQEQRDKQIAGAIEGFAPLRERYLAKAAAFNAQLARNLDSFSRAFPDFRPQLRTHLLHSLGEMDGGSRSFADGRHLIFGVDGMVQYHAAGSNESAFFHHELFHVLHRPQLENCEQVWCALWAEGLAVHAAAQLNPGASHDELLLSLPPGMVEQTEARLPEALRHLRAALDSESDAVYAGLFQNKPDGTGLPARRGYYLGWRVARELAQSHTLQALASMPAEQARPLVFAAVDRWLERELRPK